MQAELISYSIKVYVMYTVGYDIGTRFIKICLVRDGKVAEFEITEPGRDISRSISAACKKMMDRAGISSFRVKNSAATGFGCSFVNKTKLKIDIPHCLSMGVYHSDNKVKTVVDAGGLFINIARIGNNGKLIESAENEKCAAGSGKFLETIVKAVELPFDSLSDEVEKSQNPYSITNNCSVFAESEVVSRVNQGADRADILNGLLHSLVSKIETMLLMTDDDGPAALTGGVSSIEGFRKIFMMRIKRDIITLPINSRIAPAYGAALIAAEK